jgi:hypothetical protein
MIYRNRYIIEISFHARKMAIERGVTFDMIESSIKTGRIERFGKNGIKFISRYKRGNVICVGERKFENYIKILTIERG